MDCPHYLQSVIVWTKAEKSDLQTLTVMVAITAAMTSVVMIAVFVLISMKMKKKHRLKKKILPTSVYTVEKGKVEIEIPETDKIKDNLVIRGSTNLNPSQVKPSLNPCTSMSTMVTQLSQESSINLPSTDTTTSKSYSSLVYGPDWSEPWSIGHELDSLNCVSPPRVYPCI